MYNTIIGTVLVITLISQTQTAEIAEQQKSTIKPNENIPYENFTIYRRFDSNNKQKKPWKFEDFMKKFEPSTVFEQLDKQRKYNGLILSNREKIDLMIEKMDPADELLGLPIERGNPKIIMDGGGRRGWKPGKWFNKLFKDRFHLRNRLYELMKQVIYDARNKMVIMQIYRTKYKAKALYKMGFLFNKADAAARTFGKFSFRGYRGCLLYREKVMFRLPIFDLLSIVERQLNLVFNVELITDLIVDNDRICKQVFVDHSYHRKRVFDTTFKN